MLSALTLAFLVQRNLDLKAADAGAEVGELEAQIDAIVEQLHFGADMMR